MFGKVDLNQALGAGIVFSIVIGLPLATILLLVKFIGN